MGCLQSKRETSDLHPNVFRVTNVDQSGAFLCSGQLEITENDLVLYREGRDTIIWPLHSLRRYGFDGNMFSFESGRRCDTGEGIYAFRCSRAALLFRTLQQQILLRNAMILNPVSRLSPSPQGRQTVQANIIHRSSIDNGQAINMRPDDSSSLPNTISDVVVPRNMTQSPRSPSADILEVMPLYPRPQNSTNQVTNVYQLRHIKREHNNNHSGPPLDPHHVYSNDLTRDLALLRNTLRHESVLNTMRDIEDETRFLESRYINETISMNQTNNNALSPPTLITTSEACTQLNELEQQQFEHDQNQQQQQQSQLQQLYKQLPQQQKVLPRLYMNISPNDANIPEASKSDTVPSTPLNSKPIEYSNLAIGNNKPEVSNTYANLSLSELGDSIKNAKQLLGFSSSEYKQKYSEFDSTASMSPVEEIEVSYAVLDIDSNKEACKTTMDSAFADSTSTESGSLHQSRGRLVSQASIDKSITANVQSVAPAAVGYTTIDFDKTVALSSVAAGEEVGVGVEGCRKTRHNSCNIIISGTGNAVNNDKSK